MCVQSFVSEIQLGNFSIPCCRKCMSSDANSWWRFLQYYSCIKQYLSPKGMCFPLSKFSWHFNFTIFSLRVLCCYSLGCIPKLLLGSYRCHIFQFVEKICEVIWRAVRRMTCGSCFKEMVKLCFFVHFGKGYGGPAKRWLYVTQQKQCLMCTIRFIRRVFKTTTQYSNKANKEKAQTRWWYGWKQVYNICLLKHFKSLPEDSVSTVFSDTFNSFHIWELIGYLIEKRSMFQYRMSPCSK